MVFKENDGSQVAQFHVSDVDVEIPHDAIRRMGMGFFCPIEGHPLADREELCSTQVEPSSTQENKPMEQPMHLLKNKLKTLPLVIK